MQLLSIKHGILVILFLLVAIAAPRFGKITELISSNFFVVFSSQ